MEVFMKFKEKRHARILEILKEKSVETQDELTELLNQSGFQTTQATVSRDIKELHLYKTLTKDNKYKYTYSDVRNESRKKGSFKFYGIMKDSILSVDNAMNLVVIKCYSGMAQGACAAIDTLDNGEIVGTIAGDDTIFIAAKTIDAAKLIVENINNILNA